MITGACPRMWQQPQNLGLGLGANVYGHPVRRGGSSPKPASAGSQRPLKSGLRLGPFLFGADLQQARAPMLQRRVCVELALAVR